MAGDEFIEARAEVDFAVDATIGGGRLSVFSIDAITQRIL